MADESQVKPVKYFIDFENVHGAGLKGVDDLDGRDEVVIIYSQAAETFHIEHAIDIMKSKARIEFVEVDGGTRNAADFQLIVALFGAMDDAFDYVIVSGDGGFDAAVKMGERMGLPHVSRSVNIRGDAELDKPEKPKSRRSRRRRSANGDDSSAGELSKGAAEAGEAADTAETPSAAEPSRTVEPSSAAEPHPAAQLDAPGEKPANEGVAEAKPHENGGDREHASNAAEAGEVAEAGNEQEAKPSKSSRRRSRRRRSQAAQAEQSAQAEETAQEPPHEQAALSGQTGQETQEAQSEQPAQQGEVLQADAPSKREQVALLLVRESITIEDAELDTVMNALENSANRQDFYRLIIQALKQKMGLPLYRRVRDSYAAMAEIAAR